MATDSVPGDKVRALVKEQSIPTLLLRLFRHAPASRQRQFALLSLLMVFGSCAEAVGIGAVLPFLAALTQPERFYASPMGHSIAEWLSIRSAHDLLLPLTVIFCAATIVAGLVRSVLVWASTRFAFGIGSDFSRKVYQGVLHQPYIEHTRQNSSEIIDAVWGKVSEVLFFVILPSVVFLSSAIVAVVITGMLCFAVPPTALCAFFALGLAYALFIWLAKKRLAMNSRHISAGSARLVRTLQEGLGSIRDTIIDGSQSALLSEYRAVNHALRRAQGQNQILGQMPRFIVEALGMLLIAALAYVFTSGSADQAATAIPTLAAMALGMQRLLPALQQLYASWSSLHGTRASLGRVLELLDLQPHPVAESHAVKALDFERTIEFRGVGFRYADNAPWVLSEVNLTIPKGRIVGIVGPTGCGKSTLVDLAMGLLQPATGTLQVDGQIVDASNARLWQQRIAHVPQSVFLTDSSISQNIALGVPSEAIDFQRVENAAALAQLTDVIQQLPAGFETRVGERGIQLSGGQRQRIGIARALYKRADVIVFDEATSALDSATEESVMSAIEALSGEITVLMIAHRLNTLRGCDQIIELANGRIVAAHSTLEALM